MIFTIVIFILVLGLLVLVHEFGHFIVAKKSGMNVEEFGFGFPPRLIGIQKTAGKWKVVIGHKDPAKNKNLSSNLSSSSPSLEPAAQASGQIVQSETIYSINAIPFGGFVRIMGENNEHEGDERSFINKPFFPRFFTLVAGVIMNWLLAAVLFSIVLMVGVVSELEPNDPLIAHGRVKERQVAISLVQPGSPAEQAGLKREDFITNIDGRQFETSGQVQEYIGSNKGKTFEFTVKRINITETFSVSSLVNPEPGQGATGIALTDIGKIKLPFHLAIKEGVSHTFLVTKLMYNGVADLILGKVDIKNVGGPVKIAQLTGQVADLGLVALMNFTAFLSINLAILNILPLPALDGGRVLFLFIEKIRGRKNSQKVEQFANTVGFVLLLLLMLLVTIKDIRGL